MQFQAPRGTVDVLPEDQKYWRYVTSTAEEVASRAGFQRLDTPVFEDSALFERGVGSTTDIIEKETYSFEDRGGDMLTLRPEGTASACRAYLQHGMQNLPQPVRLFYLCPVFRYERPQSGRYRQHTQFGVEIIGESDASVDADVIEAGWRYLETIGLSDLSLYVNSIGDGSCRPAYMRELRSYYEGHRERICDDCQRRLDRNALRLLDCKNAQCQPLIDAAPASYDHLCDDCQAHWDSLREYLGLIGLDFHIEHRLVRGLDYYTRTVFEIAPQLEGRTVTIVGGGRYDGLIEELGGPPTPGVGFGMGLERVIQNIKREEIPVTEPSPTRVVVVHLGEAGKNAGLGISSELRRSGIAATLAPPRGMRSQMRYAANTGATHAVIIGDNELEKGVVSLRDLGRSEQVEVALDEIVDKLRRQDGE